MTKYEELKNKVSEELQETFLKNVTNALNCSQPKSDEDLPLKLEMASFIFRNEHCLSEPMIEKMLKMKYTLAQMVETLHDYVFVDSILLEIFDDAYLNDEDNREYIRELTFGEEELEEDDEEELSPIDKLEDIDCDREDLDSYNEYVSEHDEGFIHDNEDC